MKPSAIIFLFVTYHGAFAQQPVKEFSPTKIRPLELSAEGELKFTQEQARYSVIAQKIDQGAKLEQLPAEDQRIYREMDELVSNYWESIGEGCSWYCGGSIKDMTASSELTAQGNNTYSSVNAHDFSYKTAWVEGVPGPGIGQYLLYTFAPETPRITEIIVANGYIKSDRAYRDNARVKKLKVYWNDKPFAILNLEDKRSAQHFPFPPIGNGDRGDGKLLKTLPPWTLKFEILEVYNGAKYNDTAITEIYFDGIDVH